MVARRAGRHLLSTRRLKMVKWFELAAAAVAAQTTAAAGLVVVAQTISECFCA